MMYLVEVVALLLRELTGPKTAGVEEVWTILTCSQWAILVLFGPMRVAVDLYLRE
jgi:hypothetical protein